MPTGSTISLLEKEKFPFLLNEITDPPEKLYLRGQLPSDDNKFLTVVGSRKYSSYGRDVCEKLIGGLSGTPVVVVSGLALGMDAIAHIAAIESGLKTVAIPGSGLDWDVLHPRTNVPLARKILDNSGVLLSEYEPNFRATVWSFPKRNRLMAGLSHAVLVIEAADRSGTLITARLASDYNRDLLSVPASIFSHHAVGSNRLLREGAIQIRSSADILEVLGLENISDKKELDYRNLSDKEKAVIDLLKEPKNRDELIQTLNIPISDVNILLSTMEIKGIIVESAGMMRLK